LRAAPTQTPHFPDELRASCVKGSLKYMNSVTIRVLVVDDHVIVRKGTRAFLAEIEWIGVIGDTGSGVEAIRLAEELRPDVILMDLMMPEMDGVSAIRQISSQNHQVRIVIITSFVAQDKLFSALKAGAHNYLMKDSPPDELIRKLKNTRRGESEVDHRIARMLLEFFASVPDDTYKLTSRETKILQLLKDGLAETDAAQKLGMNETELRRHIFQIIQKLHHSQQPDAGGKV
jgi:DNA-binding NarL/FixJ family response regulator